jgi:hypothetical protein
MFLPNNKFVASDKNKSSALGIDEDTRKRLKVAEYYHYLTIQIRWNTIVSFLISIFELAVCVICFMANYDQSIITKYNLDF